VAARTQHLVAGPMGPGCMGLGCPARHHQVVAGGERTWTIWTPHMHLPSRLGGARLGYVTLKMGVHMLLRNHSATLRGAECASGVQALEWSRTKNVVWDFAKLRRSGTSALHAAGRSFRSNMGCQFLKMGMLDSQFAQSREDSVVVRNHWACAPN
jgi:hypothetical protein